MKKNKNELIEYFIKEVSNETFPKNLTIHLNRMDGCYGYTLNGSFQDKCDEIGLFFLEEDGVLKFYLVDHSEPLDIRNGIKKGAIYSIDKDEAITIITELIRRKSNIHTPEWLKKIAI